MRRFPAPGLPAEGGRITLDEAASHHLLRVTGVARGERVLLFDGQGLEAEAELVGVERGIAVLELEAPRPGVRGEEVWLLPALVKHEAMDTLIRMSVELGVTRILPVLAERSVARGERAERWRRVVASAAAQCGRADVPEVLEPLPLVAALERVPADLDRRIYTPGAPLRSPPLGPCALLLGPEGGWSAREVADATTRGFQPEGLGPRVLRADTAAAAVLARRLAQT